MECMRNDLKRVMAREDLSGEEKILSRFGAMTQSREAVEASKKFRRVLEMVLELGAKKAQILGKFKQMESQ